MFIKKYIFASSKMHLKISFGKWRTFYVIRRCIYINLIMAVFMQIYVNVNYAIWNVKKYENIYRSNIKFSIELYCHFGWLRVLCLKNNTHQTDFKAPLSKAVPSRVRGFGGHGSFNLHRWSLWMDKKFQLPIRQSQFSQVSGMAICPTFNAALREV